MPERKDLEKGATLTWDGGSETSEQRRRRKRLRVKDPSKWQYFLPSLVLFVVGLVATVAPFWSLDIHEQDVIGPDRTIGYSLFFGSFVLSCEGKWALWSNDLNPGCVDAWSLFEEDHDMASTRLKVFAAGTLVFLSGVIFLSFLFPTRLAAGCSLAAAFCAFITCLLVQKTTNVVKVDAWCEKDVACSSMWYGFRTETSKFVLFGPGFFAMVAVVALSLSYSWLLFRAANMKQQYLWNRSSYLDN